MATINAPACNKGPPTNAIHGHVRLEARPQKTRNEGVGRFKATGVLPPPGAKPIERWTCADFNEGYALLESDDLRALVAFAHHWGDLMELSIVPVIDDESLAEDAATGGQMTL